MLNVALVTSSIAITVGLYKINIGANFHRAMVATAPAGKLIIGRRYQACFKHKITFRLRIINKSCCHQSCTFLPVSSLIHCYFIAFSKL